MLVMMERSILQSNYSEKVVQEFSITICNVLVVVAKTLAGSGSHNGGKAVKSRQSARLFPAEKRQTVMLERRDYQLESSCISDDFERYLCINGVTVRRWKVYIYIILRVHCLVGDPPVLNALFFAPPLFCINHCCDSS